MWLRSSARKEQIVLPMAQTGDGHLKTGMSLPFELVDTIASFLAYDYHFGTIASLNQTCRGAREVTLKTLYETLVIDDPKYGYAKALEKRESIISKGFHHVKYLIVSRAIINPATLVLSHFPALVMAATFDQSPSSPISGCCAIRLHRPLSSRTVFATILAMPVRHAKNDHAQCGKPSAKRSKTGFYQPCLEEMEKPLVRPVETLASMQCDDGACLFEDINSPPKWTTRIRTHATRRPYFKPMIIKNARDVASVMEILKIFERNEDPSSLRTKDAQLREELRNRRGRPCCVKEQYEMRTWEFEATLEGMTLFVDKFSELAPSHPGLLLNRLGLFLLGSHSENVLSGLLERVKQTYVDNVTSSSQIMPYDPRPPPASVILLTLALYEGAIGNVLVCEREQGPVFDAMVTPSVEREWYRRPEMRRFEDAHGGF